MGLAPSPDGTGFWIALADGTVIPFGTAPTLGDVRSLILQGEIVDIAAGPSGYWLLGADGGIFSFDERFLGSGSEALSGDAARLGVFDGDTGYVIVSAAGELLPFRGDFRCHRRAGPARRRGAWWAWSEFGG